MKLSFYAMPLLQGACIGGAVLSLLHEKTSSFIGSVFTVFFFISFPLLFVFDVRCDIRLHVARSYTSSADSPFSLISSFTLSNQLLLALPSPVYFHFHRPPSHVVFLSCHHMPIPLQPLFLDFLCDFHHFRCPSYSFISFSFVTS